MTRRYSQQQNTISILGLIGQLILLNCSQYVFEAASLFNVITWPLGAATEQPPQPEYDRPLVLLHHLQHS